jgi:CheY-like chemotaxis protein
VSAWHEKEDSEEDGVMVSVLVIDDDNLICAMLVEVLTMEGHQVVATTDPREGLRLVYGAAQPSVVLLNLTMPYLSGVDILKQLQATPEVRARHVLLLYSSHPDLEAVAREYGADGYLRKTAEMDPVIAAVAAAAQTLEARASTT